MNASSLARWRAATLGCFIVALAIGLASDWPLWLVISMNLFFWSWFALTWIAAQRSRPPAGLLRPPPTPWHKTIQVPTLDEARAERLAWERQTPDSEWLNTTPAPIALNADQLDAAAHRLALGNAQAQLQVAISHLALVLSEPQSRSAAAAARSWLRRIGAI